MQTVRRFVHEYANLMSVLGTKLSLEVLSKSLWHVPSILKSRKLTSLDRAMSCDLTVSYRGQQIRVPTHAIDVELAAGTEDSYTFGTVREMLANDVYLRAFVESMRCGCVLDLGCNRGMFSLIAAKVLGAQLVIGVEPETKYGKIHALLFQQNQIPPHKTYWKMAGSPSTERADSEFISIDTIVRDNGIAVIDFAKIDIEGGELDLFSEPAWLAMTQNIAMELHPDYVDVSSTIAAIQRAGFEIATTDQFGRRCELLDAMFLYASRTGSLRV